MVHLTEFWIELTWEYSRAVKLWLRDSSNFDLHFVYLVTFMKPVVLSSRNGRTTILGGERGRFMLTQLFKQAGPIEARKLVASSRFLISMGLLTLLPLVHVQKTGRENREVSPADHRRSKALMISLPVWVLDTTKDDAPA